MRERTPSADDTPKRAPPAPPREAASADVAGSKTSSEAVEVFRGAKFSPTTTESPTTAATTSSVDGRMVASTHNLDDLGVSHPASASGDRQQQQEKHTYRSAQTAQDKRSRLSNVINNLRKKVPDSRNGDSPRKEEDDRNSIERNLETLEKYVMTVLNGVIKDEEDDDREVGREKEAEKSKEAEKAEDEDSKGPAAKFEPSKPNESRTEAAVFPSEQSENALGCAAESCLEYQKLDCKDEKQFNEECLEAKESRRSLTDSCKETEACKIEAVEDEEASKSSKCCWKERKPEQLDARSESQEEEKKECRSLGTIIMERLSDHQADDKGNADTSKEDVRELSSAENAELRSICRDLLNDLLNGINQLIDENGQETEEAKSLNNSSEEGGECRSQDFSMTSLHCSLPLDKVASVLQNCQANELNAPQSPSSSSASSQSSKSPCKPPSPTVRHLCLYCDRKFLSISLRQRHTERVHQQGGGRRSERNSRKPSQNCQYCSDKCSESLEGLFQHMVGSHGDKYHACVQCSTRYLTREALAGHMSENHGVTADRTVQTQEKTKEPSPSKELGNQSPRDKMDSPKERRSDETEHEHRTEPILLKPTVPAKDNFSNPGSPEFDSSFYSSVSCNIRENLLHHLDGKLQSCSSTVAPIAETKPQQTFYDHSQIQFPIDISLTAATPVYSKEYTNEEYENSSEYAQKPGKSNRSHPRRVSFEKYNFPRKYDGKEQWTCSIKDLSKFDISTQLSLRKKQQLLKERATLNRLHQIPSLGPSETTDIAQDENLAARNSEEAVEDVPSAGNDKESEQSKPFEAAKSVECAVDETSPVTEFTVEFGNFLRLRKWDEKMSNDAAKKQEVVYAELTGEWSRPRVYVCGACTSKYVTLKEMEDHKASSHPNVWCSHFEFSGDQRELYKHLFLPGKDVPTAKARNAILPEKVCTKCSKNCSTLPELHRHMLECGGDQAWLLGLFGNGKKKCKWRPFGSRSRRRRQRGMKRNIQNSQTPRVSTPKEKQPTGPRVRPSDRESIQKMLANLPPKRTTRKVLQDSALRTQGRLRNVQTRSRPRMVGDNSTASRMSRNKAALRNKLLKNAKSIQRNRCRIDNISAVIESVVRNCNSDEGKSEERKSDPESSANFDKDAKEKAEETAREEDRSGRHKVVRGPRVLGKKRNVKTKDGTTRNSVHVRKLGSLKARAKCLVKNGNFEQKTEWNESLKAGKSVKAQSKGVDREADTGSPATSLVESKSPGPPMKNKFPGQTTPKKKRPVDPVASLNASIKAKSQLRTQDGKFARNPNKDPSPQKSPDGRASVSRQLMKGNGETSPEIVRFKLRPGCKSRNDDQLPKRTTRLSSDSDKMPTLEPAVQVSSNSDEYTETSANDLPILSPATLSAGQEKLQRGKNSVGKSVEEAEGPKVEEIDEVDGKNGIEHGEEEKDQRQVKGRRAKNEAKNVENFGAKGDGFKIVAKEKLKRKNCAKIVNIEDRKATEETKKEVKQKKEDGRNNSKLKILEDDVPIKIQNVSFEVKKLIGSNSKEDLLTKLALTSRTAASKRCLRQAVPTVRPKQSKLKIRRDTESEKAGFEMESTSDVALKKDKLDARRKSLRSTDKVSWREEKLTEENKIRNTVNEGKTGVRGRRSNSLSDSKPLINVNQVSVIDSQTSLDSQSGDSENPSNKRQTRSSLLSSNDGELQGKETSNEVNDMSLKKNTSLGKRRGRIKSSNDVDKKNVEEASKSGSAEENESGQSREISLADGGKQEENENGAELEQLKSDVSESAKAENASSNNERLEGKNSMDSGKENSLKPAPVVVQKSKVGRPRKSWGSRREKGAKRSLNNVIGILTEGMNIPAETQQNVVLTVQTSLDNGNPDRVQNNCQQPEDDNSKPVSLDEADKSCDASKTVNNADRLTEEAEESRQVDASGNAEVSKNKKIECTNDKEQLPANDIILDLSRRKQKGKGSFLEKIVSKIAKQKDALLEGEVGSLLDTAADELTSILDEVGPSFPETAEGKANKPKSLKKLENSQKEMGEKLSISELVNISDNIIVRIKDTDVEVKSAENVQDKPLLKKVSDEKKIEEPSSSNEEAEESCPAESKSSNEGQHMVEKSSSKAEVELSANDGKSEENCAERIFDSNEIRLPIAEAVSEPAAEESSSKQEEKSSTNVVETVLNDAKVKRKLNKRSLGGNLPKKNKRKSIETKSNSGDSEVSEELHFADVTKQNEESKHVPSTKEIDEENRCSEIAERTQPGKRKSMEDIERKNSVENKVADDVTEKTKNYVDCVKKLKVDSEDWTDEKSTTEKNIFGDSTRIVNVTKINEESGDLNEEKSSLSIRVSGKRKSCADTGEQNSEVETKRSSKRRSQQEEKVSQSSEEETLSKVQCAEGKETLEIVPETSRRRSSRTKPVSQSMNDEKVQKEVENESLSGVNNSATAENSEECFKDSSELDNSSKKNDLLDQSMIETKTAQENSNLEDTTQISSPEKIAEPLAVPKIPKKRGRKKKILTTENVQPQVVPSENSDPKVAETLEKIPSRKSSRTNRSAEEPEESNKNPGNESQIVPPSLDNFKVPEVTEVLQHTKKRTYKRRSTTDEHSDTQTSVSSGDPEVKSTESSELTKVSMEKEEQLENSSQNQSPDVKKLERSNSSGSIDLMQSNKRRSSKRKQLSSEDLQDRSNLNNRTESVDSLSETSCVSESSYFRKKRFSKKKKEYQERAEDVQTDTSVTDSESVDAEKAGDRRQSLKRRAKKNLCYTEYSLDFLYIPMAIQEPIPQEESPQITEQEVEAKSTTTEEEKIVEEPAPDIVSKPEIEEAEAEKVETDQDTEKSVLEDEEETKEEKEEDRSETPVQTQGDFQTPKKRGAGNFVVVHKKTGEILIVEKRKKLTKEAARFFCNVCTTSFTRKSSLKKHNLSQSHLLQVIKSKKGKGSDAADEKADESCNISWKNDTSDQNETFSDENKSIGNDSMSMSRESLRDDPSEFSIDLESEQDSVSMKCKDSNDMQASRQRMEDELLDEEICKITENMSHDEYVITEHTSPTSTSTPVNIEPKPEEVKKKKQEKKKEKTMKKNLTDELLTLDTSEADILTNSLTVLTADTSVKILKSSHFEAIEADLVAEDCLEEKDALISKVSTANAKIRIDGKDDECLDTPSLLKLQENKEEEVAEETTSNNEISEVEKVYELEQVDKKTEDFQPHERLTLKFTINKRTLEYTKESNTEYDSKRVELNSSPKCESENLSNTIAEAKVESDNTSNSDVTESLKNDGSADLKIVEDVIVPAQTVEDSQIIEPPMIVENETQNESCNMENLEEESAKTIKHGKSKKGKGKRSNEELKNPLINPVSRSNDRVPRRASKSKGNHQGRQVLVEVATLSEMASDEKQANCSESLDHSLDRTEDEELENDSDNVNNSFALVKEADCKSNGLDVEDREKCDPEETLSKKQQDDSSENDKGNVGIEEIPSCSVEDEASSSSFSDKPLSELLLESDEKLGADQVEESKEEGCLNSVKISEELKIDVEAEDLNCKAVDSDDSRDNKELMNNECAESQVTSEGEILKPLEIFDRGCQSCSESENEEARLKSSKNDKQFGRIKEKSSSSGRKLKKSHRSKESHRRSKGKKAPLRSKIADLSSDSDDSDSEDKTDIQNKSKIVKSVFGRVFGGEKSDKVKEVLNDWVSKSEDDSDLSKTGFQSATSNDRKGSQTKGEERNSKRHSTSMASSSKKRSGQRSKKSCSSERVKEKHSMSDSQDEEHRSKHAKTKSGSNNRKKQDTEAVDFYSLVLPRTSCRASKKRAKEMISMEFELFDMMMGSGGKLAKQKKANYALRNQAKPDLSIKDSGYGSFNYDEDPSNLMEISTEENEKAERRKSTGSRKSKNEDDWRDLLEKGTVKSAKDTGDECSVKDLSEREALTDRLSVNLESSCSSLAPSSVRNRSPSMDRNSQTTRESDVEEEEMGHRRISPLFAYGTPTSSIENSSNSENEEEEESLAVSETTGRKRSSSEFSGEKVVIRSPSSTHKTEVVTIAPTDAIEDNALDVPQEIETAKPRQGKVLNFDEELFVECCSRLKATTENELRGAKKIKLDHSEGYHRKDDQQQGFRGPRDRWRDVESQNSLGSLLESVNQLLGEEMYSTRERDYPKRGGRNLRSELSSRSASPDMSRVDNLGYEDSLDVAFEHNNKLRDKIQQRMRESENLIATTFGQKSSNEVVNAERQSKSDEQDLLRSSYNHLQDHGHLSGSNLSNGGYNEGLHVRGVQEQASGKMNLDSSGFKNKMNSSLGGLLDKALSNLLHSNGKHDHNGSTPMKVLAELACARAPTSTAGDQTSQDHHQPMRTSSQNKDLIPDSNPLSVPKEQQKKSRNPIKELFEKKKELNERKQQEKSKTEAALRELNVHRQRKVKKNKKHQEFPLIRRNEYGGLAERKKRRDGFERKEEYMSDRIKDVYEFDEEESQIESNLGSVMSYRNRPGYEVSCLKTKDVDVAGLMSKAIGDSLENGKSGDALSTRLESMIDRKFKELEKFAPKTKGALKAFQSEEQQRQITGPMDEFVERKQPRPIRPVEQSFKHSKLRKRSKNLKKKTRNAWYENDSSDEYRTAVKTEDVGVGISKSQRTCSKGKQNLFAELYTSSESEYDDEDMDYDAKKQRRVKKITKKSAELATVDQTQELINKYCTENENRVDEWRDQDLQNDSGKNDCDHKKSESEMSDHPLVIDERKDTDDQRNSDDETENNYVRNYVLDDLYREDSSVANSDTEEPTISETQHILKESRVKSPILSPGQIDEKVDYSQEDELIPLEKALDLLDQANANLEASYDNVNRETKSIERLDKIEVIESLNNTFSCPEESTEKCSIPVEEQEEEPDNDLLSLPEKLSSNEKPQKESENLPLHVFLSRKVQESKKKKEQQLKKMQEEQERILMDLQPTRRQRKCAIGKQGLLAEISSSDEEVYCRDKKSNESHDKPRKQKRESKEKRKERYIEKKHEQMIAKEQKAIEEEILREVGKKKESLAQNTVDSNPEFSSVNRQEKKERAESPENTVVQEADQKRKHQTKEKQKRSSKLEEDVYVKSNSESLSDLENNCTKSESIHANETNQESPEKQKKHPKSPVKPRKTPKTEGKVSTGRRSKNQNGEKSKNRTDSKGSKDKERRSSSGKRDSDDEELKTTKSWNKVEEGVGVAIGRRKRAAANQLYYWSSSSDEEEMLEVVPAVEEEEDDRQEQHGWIVGDSHKKMITMLAMEKQLKEKRRRSEDEFEPSKAKSKKHRNSTS